MCLCLCLCLCLCCCAGSCQLSVVICNRRIAIVWGGDRYCYWYWYRYWYWCVVLVCVQNPSTPYPESFLQNARRDVNLHSGVAIQLYESESRGNSGHHSFETIPIQHNTTNQGNGIRWAFDEHSMTTGRTGIRMRFLL